VKILAIAGLSVREALRRRLQVNLLFFGTLLVAGSFMVSTLTLGEMRRIVSDVGLSAMEVIGTLIAVFMGATFVAGDVERRVIYPIVAKPVSRAQYLFGRYLGLSATLLLNLLVMSAALALALWLATLSFEPINRVFFAAIFAMGIQFLVVAALAILFSSVTTSTLAAIFTLSITLVGHLSNDLRTLLKGTAATVGRVLWYAIPHLDSLSLNAQVIYRTPVDASIWPAAVQGLAYAGTALALAALVFERRDFR
jgi:Cu-processing system permease protein